MQGGGSHAWSWAARRAHSRVPPHGWPFEPRPLAERGNCGLKPTRKTGLCCGVLSQVPNSHAGVQVGGGSGKGVGSPVTWSESSSLPSCGRGLRVYKQLSYNYLGLVSSAPELPAAVGTLRGQRARSPPGRAPTAQAGSRMLCV